MIILKTIILIFFLDYNRRLQSHGLSPRSIIRSKLQKAKSANDEDKPPEISSESLDSEDLTETYVNGARRSITEDGKEGLIR